MREKQFQVDSYGQNKCYSFFSPETVLIIKYLEVVYGFLAFVSFGNHIFQCLIIGKGPIRKCSRQIKLFIRDILWVPSEIQITAYFVPQKYTFLFRNGV